LKFAAVDLISGAFGLRLEVLDELSVDDDFRSGSTLVVAGYSLEDVGCSLGGADNECPPAATMCPDSDSQFCSYVSIRRCRRWHWACVCFRCAFADFVAPTLAVRVEIALLRSRPVPLSSLHQSRT